MSSLNKVMLIGNLGSEPEVKHLDSGKTVANFSIATSERYKNKSGELVENTDWHNIVIWGKGADIAEKYCSKGMKVFVEGKQKTRSYQDKDGNTRYVTEVLTDRLTILEKKPIEPDSIESPAGEEDDLPF